MISVLHRALSECEYRFEHNAHAPSSFACVSWRDRAADLNVGLCCEKSCGARAHTQTPPTFWAPTKMPLRCARTAFTYFIIPPVRVCVPKYALNDFDPRVSLRARVRRGSMHALSNKSNFGKAVHLTAACVCIPLPTARKGLCRVFALWLCNIHARVSTKFVGFLFGFPLGEFKPHAVNYE